MLTRDFKFRVWYKDTDQMGIVHHSNYICYYEAARSELLRSFGSSYADMEEKDGVMMPILEVHSKYLRPAHYGFYGSGFHPPRYAASLSGSERIYGAVGKKPVIHAVFYESPVDRIDFSQEEDISDFRRWRNPDESSVRFYPI